MYFLIVRVGKKNVIYTHCESKQTLIKRIRRGLCPVGKIVFDPNWS
jgi:hypothetical protein